LKIIFNFKGTPGIIGTQEIYKIIDELELGDDTFEEKLDIIIKKVQRYNQWSDLTAFKDVFQCDSNRDFYNSVYNSRDSSDALNKLTDYLPAKPLASADDRPEMDPRCMGTMTVDGIHPLIFEEY